MENNLFTFSFKKFLCGSIIALATFSCLNVLLLLGMREIDSNYALATSIQASYLPNLENTDILFMGDSRTHQSISPTVFEGIQREKYGRSIQAYNLARPGMQGPFFFFTLNNILSSKKGKPKVIIVQFSYYLLGGQNWLKAIYMDYYSPTIREVIDASQGAIVWPELLKNLSWYISTKVPSITFRKKYTGLFAALTRGELIKEIHSGLETVKMINDPAMKGYLSRGADHITLNQAKKSVLTSCPDKLHLGYSNYTNYLKRFFDMAAANDIYVIVYKFPYSRTDNMADHNILIECENHFFKIIKDVANNNKHIMFIDNLDFYDFKLFSDPLHLNHDGGEILTASLSEKYNDFLSNNTIDKRYTKSLDLPSPA